MELQAEPRSAEKVCDSHAEDQSRYAGGAFPAEMLGKQAADGSQEDKTYQVASGRPCKFSHAAREPGEDREPAQTEKKIDQIAYGCLFPPEKKDGDPQYKVGQRQRDRAYGYGDGHRCEYACDRCHKGGEHKAPGREPRAVGNGFF